MSFRFGLCPSCGKTVFVRYGRNEWGVRCARCKAAPNTLGIVFHLKRLCPNFTDKSVYILSHGGPLFKFLQYNCSQFRFSQYFDDVEPGDYKNGVQCQDVQQLTFLNDSFDICLNSEVFEHVPNDIKGFAEIYRVLRPGGVLIFTVPLDGVDRTVERACIEAGKVHHLMEQEFHTDPVRGEILCFRNYGLDIVDRLKEVGFSSAEITAETDVTGLGYGRRVIIASKCLPRVNKYV